MIDFNNKELYPIFCLTSFKLVKYSRDLNFYHTIHHIHDMLKLASKDIEYIKTITDVDCFITAIAYHDIVYRTNRQDNEMASAKIFETTFNWIRNEFDKNFSDEKRQLIFDLILSTQFGYDIKTEAEKLLHDYDYMNFSDKSKMEFSDKQILNECLRDNCFNFNLIISKRMEFYKLLYDNAIKSGRFFLTDKYSYLNELAIKNIKEYII